MILYDFKNTTQKTDWVITDDVVMGGCSRGAFSINAAGHGVFQGNVSLDNNGGFSSVRYRFSAIRVDGFTKLIIRLKGDGNPFQCRVKSSAADQYSYVAVFETTAEWASVEIWFSNMFPSFRGQKLTAPNYPGLQMKEIAFLIGHKKATDFTLEIDNILLA